MLLPLLGGVGHQIAISISAHYYLVALVSERNRHSLKVCYPTHFHLNFPFESILEGVRNEVHEDLDDSGLVKEQELGNLFVHFSLEEESFVKSSSFVGWHHFVYKLSDFHSISYYLELSLSFYFFNVKYVIYNATQNFSGILRVF